MSSRPPKMSYQMSSQIDLGGRPPKFGRTIASLMDTLNIVDSAHRDSTVRQYQAIWSKFLEYVDYNNISHTAITLDIVMNFSHQKHFLHKVFMEY